MGKAAGEAGEQPSGLLPVVSEAGDGHKRLKIANIATKVSRSASF